MLESSETKISRKNSSIQSIPESDIMADGVGRMPKELMWRSSRRLHYILVLEDEMDDPPEIMFNNFNNSHTFYSVLIFCM